jgi:hypothetical protein
VDSCASAGRPVRLEAEALERAEPAEGLAYPSLRLA